MRFDLAGYRRVFALRGFRNFWLGFTLSGLGDAMTRVALTWHVWETTRSPQALGWLAFCYTAPVIAGGLAAGWLLDRFDRRRVMLVDNLLRCAAVAVVPVLAALGRLELWHVYAVAAAYGALMMISLAGGPALVPALVPREALPTANALEMLSFTLSGVVGPFAAGLLLERIGAPNVVLLDALSYLFFAIALARVPAASTVTTAAARTGRAVGLGDAARLLLGHPVLLATTLMFMVFNLGFGAAAVWLPVYAEQVLGGGPELYGWLLGCLALGEVLSAVATGGWQPRVALGTLICLAQALAGAALALLLVPPRLAWAVVGLALFGLFSAPLTIWAQTLRMHVIPEALRGRTFALLRTLMQGANPFGGLAGGWLLPLLGLPLMVALSAALVAAPGLLGLRVRELRE